MRTGAPLMAGWTVLLLWADRQPLERRGVLPITVLPVIAGLMANDAPRCRRWAPLRPKRRSGSRAAAGSGRLVRLQPGEGAHCRERGRWSSRRFGAL